MTIIEKKTVYNALATYADVMERYEKELRNYGEIDAAIDAMQEKNTAKAIMSYWQGIIQMPCGSVKI